jgi:hypothetical protein
MASQLPGDPTNGRPTPLANLDPREQTVWDTTFGHAWAMTASKSDRPRRNRRGWCVEYANDATLAHREARGLAGPPSEPSEGVEAPKPSLVPMPLLGPLYDVYMKLRRAVTAGDYGPATDHRRHLVQALGALTDRPEDVVHARELLSTCPAHALTEQFLVDLEPLIFGGHLPVLSLDTPHPLVEPFQRLRQAVISGNLGQVVICQQDLVCVLCLVQSQATGPADHLLAAQRQLAETPAGDLTLEFLVALEFLVFGTRLAPVSQPLSQDSRVAAAIAILDQGLPHWDDRWGDTAREALEVLRGDRHVPDDPGLSADEVTPLRVPDPTEPVPVDEATLKDALESVAGIVTPETCRNPDLLHDFLEHQSDVIHAVDVLGAAMRLPPVTLQDFLDSPNAAVREWAQAVIDGHR